MSKTVLKVCCVGLGTIAAGAFLFFIARSEAAGPNYGASSASEWQRPIIADSRFEVDILVNGRPIDEYYSRGRSYVEAIPGAEYEVRLRNPLPYRVAVALSVDGLNSIDARRTSAWNASKWVIEAYGTIHIGGWQMSSERARRFYFTTERDSYAARLGQTSNLGVISAVFFREVRRVPVPIAPPPRPRPLYRDEGERDRQRSEAPSPSAESQKATKAEKRGTIAPLPDDEYAATGIGRSVRNDVRWVDMDLEPHPAAEVVLRYEYYQGLVRLGIMPRPYPQPDPLRRREGATGFEDRRFSPEP
ncbi:MAG: hypothetical protein ACREBG_14440 [Pyrinomonadaceae bacterium]